MTRVWRVLFLTGISTISATIFLSSGRAADAHRPSEDGESHRENLPNSSHPIDRIIASYFDQHDVAWGEPVDDRQFIRRVSMDLVGLLPTPDQVDQFVSDPWADKRTRLVQQLLGDDLDYAFHWMSFWSDLLRNAYRGTGFIDDGRSQITQWLFRALWENKPYDQFVRELIDPAPGAEGFTKGIQWRGVVNASQRREMQAAQTLSQVFLAINLKCASCHDSFISNWQLTDAYGLASVFSDQPLQVHRCDKPTGVYADPSFLYEEMGVIDAKATRPERIQQLARILTAPRDRRLSRTVVNRIWERFFGVGIVADVDDLDQPAFSDELLEWLATDLQDHHYDLKQTMERICTSRVYQLRSVGAPTPARDTGVFQGPRVRRLSAEQLVDAISTVTGVWPPPDDGMLKKDDRGQGGQLAAVMHTLTAGDNADAVPTSSSSAVSTGTEAAPSEGESGSDNQKKSYPRIRAVLLDTDPLLRGLGRPNREQVVSRRESIATTLEALELTLGATLARKLNAGARNWIGRFQESPTAALDQLYLIALNRRPTADEATTAIELVGAPPSMEGVEDLLWTVMMLPEFQLIY